MCLSHFSFADLDKVKHRCVHDYICLSYTVLPKVPVEVLSIPTIPSPGLCDVTTSIHWIGLFLFKTILTLALISLQGSKYHSPSREAVGAAHLPLGLQPCCLAVLILLFIVT